MSPAGEKWAAWEAKLVKLAPVDRQRATEVLLRLLKVREARATS